MDGLRALAALSVLGYHAWLYTRERVTPACATSPADYVAHELRLGLVLFFVLSGFLLYRAVGARRAGRRSGAAGRRLPAAPGRRASCPPTGWRSRAPSRWSGASRARPACGSRRPRTSGCSRVFGQNFTTPTLLRLNAPLWTLAVEASFYVVLPALGWLALRLRGAGREAQALVPTRACCWPASPGTGPSRARTSR